MEEHQQHVNYKNYGCSLHFMIQMFARAIRNQIFNDHCAGRESDVKRMEVMRGFLTSMSVGVNTDRFRSVNKVTSTIMLPLVD